MGERILDIGGKYVFQRFEITSNLWMLYTFDKIIRFHMLHYQNIPKEL